MTNIFNLKDKFVFITGAAGLLGRVHADAILEAGGTVVLSDIDEKSLQGAFDSLVKKHGDSRVFSTITDVTNPESVLESVRQFPRVNVLINNAARNPKVNKDGKVAGQFETMTKEEWRIGIEITLDGTFVCSQIFCNKFLKDGGGNIINIASDLGVIAPDQRIYDNGKKPITYSASKFGIVGMTKYLATYFADRNIRVNCLSPGGVRTDQPLEFVEKLENLIPAGRMATPDEYKGAIIFLCSDASSYMTGANLIIDGGRTVW